MEGIRPMLESDWERVAEIYREGIETNLSTFETACPEYAAWDAAHRRTGRLVCERDGRVLGWVALSPVSGRCAYQGVAEVSIYVADEAKRTGIGAALLNAVIEASEGEGIWTLQSVVMEENGASIALHRKCGFRVIGTREKIARDRYGAWRNTVLLERRSRAPRFLEPGQEKSRPESRCAPAGCRTV